MTVPPRSVVAGIAGVTLLTACSPEPIDFRSDAENLLTDELTREPGGTWTATCVEPTSADVDTTFACAVTDADGVVRNFTATITGRAAYTVAEETPPAG